MSIVRIVLWNLADSKTTLDEVREQLPALAEGNLWIANAAQERFGLVSTAESPPDLTGLRDHWGQVLHSVRPTRPDRALAKCKT